MPLTSPPRWFATPRSRGFFAVWAVLGTAFLVLGLTDGDEGGHAAWFGIFWLGNAPAFLPGRGLGAETRDGALAIPASPLHAYAPLAGGAALVLGAAVSDGVTAGLSLLAVWAVVVAWVVLQDGLGEEIRLDPEGVSLRRHRLSWADAADVRTRWFGRVRVGGVSARIDCYEADPVVLYWTLRYYATHPESRDELADGRAVERVAREALV